MAQISTPFDPFEVGEVDNFAFDFSYNIGAAIIVGGSWNCTLAPNQTVIDNNPQGHVSSVSIPTMIAVVVPPGAQIVNRAGNYVLAQMGPFTPDLAGATYIFEATAYLNDGRVLNLSS